MVNLVFDFEFGGWEIGLQFYLELVGIILGIVVIVISIGELVGLVVFVFDGCYVSVYDLGQNVCVFGVLFIVIVVVFIGVGFVDGWVEWLDIGVWFIFLFN